MKINNTSYQDMLNGEKPKPSQFVKFIFFAFGISSLSGWNATLTALDYFGQQFQDYNVAFDFPVPMFISSCIMAFILPKITPFLTMNLRLAWALIVICAILVLMPLAAAQFPNDQGFMICMGLIFLLGLVNSLQSGSALALASILGGEYVGIFCVGTGFSGATICIFRMICLASTKDQALSCLVYFCVAAAWNLLSFMLYFQFKQTDEYEQIMVQLNKQEQSTAIITDIDGLSDSQIADSVIIGGRNTVEAKINRMDIFQTALYVNKIAFPVPLCIILIYIQTFMMFPGMSLEKIFPQEYSAWVLFSCYKKGPTLLIFTYGIGDTVGKQLAGYRNLYSETSLIIMIFMRFGFFVSFYLIVKGDIEPYWFSFLNLFLFAATNGFTTSGMMQLGPEKVPDYMKEKVGFIQGFSLLFGIMLGSFLALPLQYIKATN